MHETLADTADAIDDQHAYAAMQTRLNSAVGLLSPIQGRVTVRYFGLQGHAPKTLEQIGRSENITRERIRQIRNQALIALRKKIPALKTYLRGP